MRAGLLAVCVVLTACRPTTGPAPILLFNGAGTSPEDVASLEKILSGERLQYSLINSRQLKGMTESEILRSRLLIVPGGNFERLGNSLTSSSAANIRTAVRNGLNYLGICAGAFFAANSPYNGLNLTSGPQFSFYAAEARGIRKQVAPISTAEGQTLEMYWEDGPQLSGWGSVVARYPDGTPAIAEGSFGTGWVILTGVHPEAPASWRRGFDFKTPEALDHAYAATLIHAALARQTLPHF